MLNYAAILAVCFFAGAGNFMNVAIHSFEEAFPDVSEPTIMLVSTLPCLIAVPVMLLAGRLVGRKISYRAVCIAGTVLIVVGGVLPCFVTKSWAFILVCRAVLGIGAGCYGVRNSLIIRTVPADQVIRLTGYSTVALTLGGTLAGPVAGALASKAWNLAFLYDAVPLLILILVIAGLKEPERLPDTLPDTLPTEGAERKRGGGKLTWRIYFYALTQLLIIGTLYPMTVSGVSIYFDAYELGSPALAGTVMSLFPLFGVLGNLFLHRIMRLLGRFTIPAMCLAVIAGSSLSLLSHTMTAVALSYSLAGFGYHIIIGVLQVYNGGEAPREKMAFGSTMILAAKSVGIFLSSYFITACAWLFALKGRIHLENAFLGCIVVYGILMVFTAAVNVEPLRGRRGTEMEGSSEV